MSQTLEKRPVGRPTDYRPEYCDMLLADATLGMSLTAFAGLIGVARATINNWMRDFPEFLEATRIHQSMRTRALELDLMKEAPGSYISARIFALKNADPDGWRDRVEVNQTTTVTHTLDLSSLTDEELRVVSNLKTIEHEEK